MNSFKSLVWGLASLSFCLLVGGLVPKADAAVPVLPVSQVPLTVVIPAHPQVVIAIGNSQSMDGDLSGAIMTGSGALGPSLPELQHSSSPVNYTVPSGFTPPLNTGSGGTAPYTVASGGYLYDNSASRLNEAKDALRQVFTTYVPDTDFSIMDYSTSGANEYTTWVYYMSGQSGFQFSATAPATGEYAANPCYGNTTGSDTVNHDCAQIASILSGQNVAGDPYMLLGASSDDPSINDVLYAPASYTPVFLDYGTHNPMNPFPPNYTLNDYNNGNVSIGYSNCSPGPCVADTGPTNAGYVPYSPQVMYVERGFGFYSDTTSANAANTVVPMTSAGQSPTSASVATAYNTLSAPLVPESNTFSTPDIKALATQSPIAGLVSGAGNYLLSNPPTSNGCAAAQFVVLVTDGLPTEDLGGKSWPPLGSVAAVGYGETAVFSPTDGHLLSTNDQALQDAVTALGKLAAKGIKTYIIGLGAGVNPANNPQAAATLTAMADAGGTLNYFPAYSPTDIVNDLNVIMQKIQAATQSTSSAAVNSTGLNAGSVVYQAQFTTSDADQDWTGNLLAYPINPANGQVITNPHAPGYAVLWSAQQQLDAQNWDAGRNIVTWNPALHAGVPFRWSASTGIYTTTTMGRMLMTGPTDTLGPARLDYLRGDTSGYLVNGGVFRNRTHILGDIVDSDPLYIGAPLGPYSSSSYLAFISANQTRKPVIYVGANDGMLHAFDAATGQELFAFIPYAVWPNLINLTKPLYNEQHHFYVDGSPQAGDVQFSDGSWHTLLVGGENAGGNSIYAVDVTDPSTFSTESQVASDVKWEFTDSDMGYSYSVPQIIYTQDSASPFMVAFGNGYDSPNSNAVFYAVDAQTGALIDKINLCASVSGSNCSSSLPNGLSSITVVNESGLMGEADTTVFAGDLQGHMWEINIASPVPSQWKATLLFTARNASGQVQPITDAPAVAQGHLGNPSGNYNEVMFGTGELLNSADLTNTDTQSFYQVMSNATKMTRSYLSQVNIATSTVGGTAVITGTAGNTILFGSPMPFIYGAQPGWYIDFPTPGERVVTDPRVENSAVVYTTYLPNTNTCVGGGSSYLWDVNDMTGANFPQPELAINGDTNLDAGDQTASGQNPIAVSLGNVFAAAPTIVSAALSPIHAVKLVTESSGAVQSVLERGGYSGQEAWWQIQ